MKILACFTLLILSSLGGCSSSTISTEELIATPAPGARVTLLDGEQLPLSSFRGKKAILFFWDTRCSRSNSIMRSFKGRISELSRRNDLSIVTVSIDKNKDLEAVKERLAGLNGRPFVHAFSGNDILDEAYCSFHGSSIPLFVLLDAQGVVRAVGHSESEFDEMLNA